MGCAPINLPRGRRSGVREESDGGSALAIVPGADRSGPLDAFWSSSAANGKELAWYVRFDHGNGLYGRLIEPFRVRCVQQPRRRMIRPALLYPLP